VLPWRAGSPLPWHFAFGYLGAALVIWIAKFFPKGDAAPEHE
jgi:hypothetical protein